MKLQRDLKRLYALCMGENAKNLKREWVDYNFVLGPTAGKQPSK